MLGQLSLVLIVASSAMSAALAGYAAWQYQASRYEARIADMEATAAAAVRQTEKRYAEFLKKASDQNAARQRVIRADADSARRESDRLRDELSAFVDRARNAPTSCPDAASAIVDVLRDMEAEARELAAACDRHVEDIRTLMTAWPR
jgi:hypothetical protein